MTFGEKLKSIRERRGMSQADFAELLGTSAQNLCRYENSTREPSVRTVNAYAEKLGVDPKELIGDFNGVFHFGPECDLFAGVGGLRLSQAKRELIDAIDGLTDEQCEHLKALVDMVKR